MKAKWTKLASSLALQRSSHCLSVVNNQIYVYGGELRPREPVDNDIHVIDIAPLNKDASQGPATSESPRRLAYPTAPQSRVGAASTVLNGKIYIFSGRGGVAMAPIEEHGAFHVFEAAAATTSNATESSWTILKPAEASNPKPEGRSYHALTSNGHDTIYLHAGCPAQGRLSDLWAFNVNERTWKELVPAPKPARGGPSIAYLQGKVYRMHGFDGEREQGGVVDVYDTIGDRWEEEIEFCPDGREGPGKRSVACLLAVEGEREGGGLLLTMFGESDPSNLGHQGAGKMLGDAWVYDAQGKGWEKVEWHGEGPPARGWFDADVWMGGQGMGVVVGGGLAESNERLDDVWLLKFLR